MRKPLIASPKDYFVGFLVVACFALFLLYGIISNIDNSIVIQTCSLIIDLNQTKPLCPYYSTSIEYISPINCVLLYDFIKIGFINANPVLECPLH